jgi:hypothetical protein
VEYAGETPVRPNASSMEEWKFIGWNPDPVNVTGDMYCVAQFKNNVSYARLLVQRTLSGDYTNDRVTSVGVGAFYECVNLTDLDFALVNSIREEAFMGCSSLTTLILRSKTLCTLSNTNALTGTKIESGTGFIYVPSELMNSYKSVTNWSKYAAQFRAIEDYPEICGGE